MARGGEMHRQRPNQDPAGPRMPGGDRPAPDAPFEPDHVPDNAGRDAAVAGEPSSPRRYAPGSARATARCRRTYQFSGRNYQTGAPDGAPYPCQPGDRLPIYADNNTTVDVLVDLAHTTLPLREYGFIPTPLEIMVRSPSGARQHSICNLVMIKRLPMSST